MARKKIPPTLSIRNVTLAFGGAVVIIVVVTLILHYVKVGLGNGTVFFTTEGVEPVELVVRKGTTVTFKTKTGEAFWPASNFHPNHGLYPEFDSRRPIEATSSWQFTFKHLGRWRFHDHLHPSRGGVVRVVDVFGSSENPNCKAIKAEFLSDIEKFSCWTQDIEEIFRTKGLSDAFQRVYELYETDPGFASNCHDVTHILGEASYRLYSRDGAAEFTDQTATCGWGFYHGFLEALLHQGQSWATAVNFCNDTNTQLKSRILAPNAIYSCFHGIGHGVFDSLGSELWGNDIAMVERALTVCNTDLGQTEEIFLKQCASGVFNSLSNAYGNQTYNLSFDNEDPFHICDLQANEEFRKACYTEVSIGFIRKEGWDNRRAVSFIRSIPDTIGATASMYSYISDEVRRYPETGRNGTMRAQCEGMPFSLAESCIEGVSWGLLGNGEPKEEWRGAVSFCSEVRDESLRDSCFTYVMPILSSMYSREKTEEICNSVDSRYMQYCFR